MSKQFATLDQTSLGALLGLSQGGAVVTCNTDATDISRNARASQTLTGSRWSWEVAAFGTATLGAGNFAAGIVLAATANNDYPGHAAGTIGMRGDGQIWVNGANVSTVPTPQKQQIIRFELDLISGTNTLAIYLNNLLLYTANLSAGQSWQPAVSVGATVANDLSAYVNFGVRRFASPPSANFKPGVFTNPSTQPPIFVASESFYTSPTSSPANQYYEKRIRFKDSIDTYIGRSTTFFTDGQVGSSEDASDVNLYNGDHALTWMLQNPPIGALVVHAIKDLDSSADPIVIGTMMVESVSQPDARTIRIKQKSALGRFDVPMQDRLYPPWAPDGSANLPYRISLGACREVPADRPIDAQGLERPMHDAPLTAVVMLRDKGDPFNPAATPPDYTMSGDLTGVMLNVPPVGTVTGDISSQGSSTLTPTTGTDILAGAGSFNGSAPGTLAGVSHSTGGTLGAGLTLVYAVTAIVGGVETPISNEFTLTTGAGGTNSNVLTWAAPSSGTPTAYNIYKRDTDSLALSMQALGNVLTFTDTSAGWSAGEPQPPAGWTATVAEFNGVPRWTGAGGGRMQYVLRTVSGSSGSLVGAQVYARRALSVGDIQASKRYRLKVDIADSSWSARIIQSNIEVNVVDGGGASHSCGNLNVNAVPIGTYTIDFVSPVAGAYLELQLGNIYQAPTGPLFNTTFTVDLDNVSLVRLPDPPDPNAPLIGITLENYMREIIEVRKGFDSSVWSSASAAAIDTAMPWSFGVSQGDQIATIGMIREPLDSFGASTTADEQGRLIFPLLLDPDLVADADLAWTFHRSDIVSMPLGTTDKAPGLTTTAYGRRNCYVFTTNNEFVTDYNPATGIDAATRAKFMRPGQYRIVSAANLHDAYLFARNAGELVTVLDNPVHVQTLMDSVGAKFVGKARVDYTFVGSYQSATPPSILPGSVIKVFWEPLGREPAHPVFATGKNLLVKRVKHFARRRRFQFDIAWG